MNDARPSPRFLSKVKDPSLDASKRLFQRYALAAWMSGGLGLEASVSAQAAQTGSNASPLNMALLEGWPSKPIRLIVPFAPGGGNDTVARAVSERLSNALGQRVVVDNKGGAGGALGAELAARAEPDGYTLFLGGVGSLAINPATRETSSYDPIKDFAPISLLALAPLVVAVHPSLGVSSLAELVKLSKDSSQPIAYASNGVGSSSHLATELFCSMAGLQMTHVPYKGLSPALADLLAGQVKLMFSSSVAILPHLSTSRLRVLATTGAKRSALFPDLPTVAQAGWPGYRANSWYGILAPAGTPSKIVDRINGAIESFLVKDDFKSTLAGDGAEIAGGRPEQFAQFIHEELERMRVLVKKIHLHLD
jgi:tripartite-type tricarboxylate transporter receptor subunit TctC